MNTLTLQCLHQPLNYQSNHNQIKLRTKRTTRKPLSLTYLKSARIRNQKALIAVKQPQQFH